MSDELIIRNVEVEGRTSLDVRVAAGRVAEIGRRVRGLGETIDGRGGALIPGLVDHHIHLFALAAQQDSILLDDVANVVALKARIRDAAASKAACGWLRATGYHEAIAGDLDRHVLDALAPRHRLRVQHQTGSLWILNSLALEAIISADAPDGLERDAGGVPTGRLWRGDAWLRERMGAAPPSLAPIGRRLAALGITAVTDASVTTDTGAAARIAAAARAGDLPQRLALMSGGALAGPADGSFAVGPVKILLDDHALPPLDAMIETIGQARVWRREVAVHCVTAGELAMALAAFQAAGARAGDRIEHGGVIPASAIPEIRTLGLTVVTQPAFVRERGDRYLAEVESAEQADLYRCASLIAAGVPVAASSDAPYASPDPWAGMVAAIGRQTLAGKALGLSERVAASTALCLYLADAASPGGPTRRVAVGAAADLCLLDAPLDAVLMAPCASRVRATIIDGRLRYLNAAAPAMS